MAIGGGKCHLDSHENSRDKKARTSRAQTLASGEELLKGFFFMEI